MKIRGILENPVFLLLATGTLIGFNFPLGKIAGDAEVSSILWAFLISFGASLTLLPFLLINKSLKRPSIEVARYSFISGLISFAAANLLLFAVIPRVGSGYTGLMFALSPVFTLAISVLLKLKSPNRIGIIGIVIGFAGASIVAFSRQTGENAPQLIWMLAAFLIPATLAIGNVYRTIAWPQGASPDVLAFWAHASSATMLFIIAISFNGIGVFGELARVPLAAGAQMIVAGATFPIFFRLQHHGGPVLLSQIGYVAAAVGLVFATVFLSEIYGPLTWIGAGIIALGIGVTILAQRVKKN